MKDSRKKYAHWLSHRTVWSESLSTSFRHFKVALTIPLGSPSSSEFKCSHGFEFGSTNHKDVLTFLISTCEYVEGNDCSLLASTRE
ncbi:unnamed protein product [Orchesella dallaii]|uniref:Uncharacterized protein n=1 Tax=Orchesella dallaii TaxID=48710 RepID=A0ABP1R538_9HEXA